MKTPKIVVGLLIVAMVLTLTACSSNSSKPAPEGDSTSAKPEMTLKFAHMRTTDSEEHQFFLAFKEYVEEKSDGRIKIDIYPNNELGDYTTVQEAVAMGDIDIMCGTPSSSVDPHFTLATFPYLCTNWDEVFRFYKKGGFINEIISERFEKQGIKPLSPFPQYFGSVILAHEPKNPEDLTASRNVKIRCPSMKPFELVGEKLGFQVTPMPSSEAFTAIQTGIVDGMIGGGNTGYYQKFSEVCKYVMNTKNHLECHWLYMNKKLFDSLSPDDQKIILDAAKQIEDAGFDWAKNNEQKYIDLMKQAGWTSYEYTDEEIAAFAENVRTEIWPQLEPLYDPEVWAELVSHFK